jgi:hypothetical protein
MRPTIRCADRSPRQAFYEVGGEFAHQHRRQHLRGAGAERRP